MADTQAAKVSFADLEATDTELLQFLARMIRLELQRRGAVKKKEVKA
jgi:hypothetical protein